MTFKTLLCCLTFEDSYQRMSIKSSQILPLPDPKWTLHFEIYIQSLMSQQAQMPWKTPVCCLPPEFPAVLHHILKDTSYSRSQMTITCSGMMSKIKVKVSSKDWKALAMTNVVCHWLFVVKLSDRCLWNCDPTPTVAHQPVILRGRNLVLYHKTRQSS